MALTKIDDRGLKTPIDLLDSEKIRFGTGNDLQIFHSGVNSVIDNNTGGLYIRNNVAADVGGDIFIQAKSGENSATFTHDGDASLYYDNSQKFHTRSDGVRILGDATWSDDGKARFGPDGDLQIYHNGSNRNLIESHGGHEIHINKDTSESCAKFKPDGNVELYYDNSKKLYTTSSGAECAGYFKATGGSGYGFIVPDSVKISLGESNDLTLVHDGSDTTIKNITGEFQLRGDTLILASASTYEKYLKGVNDGAVELYYDDSKKFETTSTGVKIESSSATELKLTSSTSSSASIEFGDTDDDDEAQIWYDNYGKTLNFRTSEASDLVFYRDGTERTRITSTGTETAGYNKSFLVKSDSAFGSTSAHVIQSNNNNQVATIIEHSGDTNPYGLMISFSDDDPDDNSHYFLKCEDGSNTNRLFIYSDGDVWNHDNSYTGSDQTLKENIVDATPKLEDLKKLKVRNFNWKAEYFPGKSKKKQLGFIAQEVEEVFPALVSEHDIAAGTPNDGHVPLIKKAIKQAWDPIIIKAMQELIEKVETLETEVAALKAK